MSASHKRPRPRGMAPTDGEWNHSRGVFVNSRGDVWLNKRWVQVTDLDDPAPTRSEMDDKDAEIERLKSDLKESREFASKLHVQVFKLEADVRSHPPRISLPILASPCVPLPAHTGSSHTLSPLLVD